MNNVNILMSVLHLKEASDLLVNELPDVSFTLLEMSNTLLNNYNISSDDVNSTTEIASTVLEKVEEKPNV